MTGPLLLSAGKIASSVILLVAVLWGVSRLARLAKLDPEVGRKLVHISLGLYCLTFPYVFSEAWEVLATCGLALLVFLAARGTARKSLGGGLHAVERTSYGELLFAVSVALLFWLKDGHFISNHISVSGDHEFMEHTASRTTRPPRPLWSTSRPTPTSRRACPWPFTPALRASSSATSAAGWAPQPDPLVLGAAE